MKWDRYLQLLNTLKTRPREAQEHPGPQRVGRECIRTVKERCKPVREPRGNVTPPGQTARYAGLVVVTSL